MNAASIPAGLVVFTIGFLAVVVWLGLAALEKRDGYRQDTRDGGPL